MTNNAGNHLLLRLTMMFLFIVFGFTYLYCFQGELLALTQHVLSRGATTYSPLIGALVIMAIAVVAQYCYVRYVRIPQRVYALSYIPSSLFLVFTTSLYPLASAKSHIAAIIVVLALSVFVTLKIKRLVWARLRVDRKSVFNLNLLLLLLLFVAVALAGNTDEQTHYELRVERLLLQGKCDDALKVARKEERSSQRLTALRAYALARKGTLDEHIFAYALPAGRVRLLADRKDSLDMIFSPDSIYQLLGDRKENADSDVAFLQNLSDRDGKRYDVARSYLLCQLLLDKQVDAFAKCLKRLTLLQTTGVNTRSYSQAIALYQHIRTNPVINIDVDDAVEEDFQDFLDTRRLQHAQSPATEKAVMWDKFGKTYWYYYYYHNLN